MLNLSKLLFVVLLIALSIIDLSMMFTIAETDEIFDVQYVSVGIKIATFVSKRKSIEISC